MTEFAQWLWQFNTDVSLLLGIVLIARAVLRRFANFYNLYVLWLSLPLALIASAILSRIDFSESSVVAPVQRVVYQFIPNTSIVTESAVRPSFDWLSLALAMTLSIAFMLGVRLLFQHLNLRRELKRIRAPQALSIRSHYPLVPVNKDGFSPAVYGFVTPTIYFPAELAQQLSDRQLDLIVKHEEQHIRQGHLWLNLAWDALVCVLWFNPIVYFARQGFRHDQELYCDYLVLKNSDSHDQRYYGHALLSTVSATHSVSLLCSWKMFNHLEERILNIKSTFNTSKKVLISIAAGLLVCFASVYSLAMASEEAKEDRKVKVIVKEKQKHKVKVDNDEISYIEEGGEKYVIENGQRRTMTEEDQAKYEELMAEIGVDIDAEIDLELDGELSDGHRVVSIRTNSDSDDVQVIEVLESLESLGALESLKALEGLKGLEGLAGLASLEGLIGLEGLKDLKDLEALKELEALGDIDIEVFSTAVSGFSSAEHELARALKSIERAAENGNANKAQLKKSAKELKAMQKQLAKERAKMEKTRERARLAAKRAQEEASRAPY